MHLFIVDMKQGTLVSSRAVVADSASSAIPLALAAVTSVAVIPLSVTGVKRMLEIDAIEGL